jgi:hypothetical protein
MSLEDRLFIPNTTSYAVVVAHNISKLVKCLENMDSNTSIESSWFK